MGKAQPSAGGMGGELFFTLDEYRERLARVRRMMAERGVDASTGGSPAR